MTCKDLLQSLTDYMLGTLNTKQVQEVERHFRHCPTCTAVINTYKATCGLAQGIPPKETSADLRAQLISSIKEKVKQEDTTTSSPILVTNHASPDLRPLSKRN